MTNAFLFAVPGDYKNIARYIMDGTINTLDIDVPGAFVYDGWFIRGTIMINGGAWPNTLSLRINNLSTSIYRIYYILRQTATITGASPGTPSTSVSFAVIPEVEAGVVPAFIEIKHYMSGSNLKQILLVDIQSVQGSTPANSFDIRAVVYVDTPDPVTKVNLFTASGSHLLEGDLNLAGIKMR